MYTIPIVAIIDVLPAYIYDHMISHRQFLFLLFIFCVGLFFWLIYPFIGVVLFAIITVYFFNPIYRRFANRSKKNIGLAMSWISIVFVLLIPLAIISTSLINQIKVFVNDIQATTSEHPITIDSAIEKINTLLVQIPYVDYQIEKEEIRNRVLQSVSKISWSLAEYVYVRGMGITDIGISIILYVLIVSWIFIYQYKIIFLLKRIIPLEEKNFELYIMRITAMGSSMIKWTFLIALIQGIISGISFWIAGIPYVFFWTLLITFLSLIPFVGAGIIAFPAGLILLFNGHIREGITVLSINIIIVGNIDSLLRPRLVNKEAELPSALLLLSVFGAMQLFGFMGFLYGPVIMIFIVTTIKLYAGMLRNEKLWEQGSQQIFELFHHQNNNHQQQLHAKTT